MNTQRTIDVLPGDSWAERKPIGLGRDPEGELTATGRALLIIFVCMVSSLAMFVVVTVALPLAGVFSLRQSLRLGVGAGLIPLAVLALASMKLALAHVVNALERLTQWDINRDGAIAGEQPAKAQEVIRFVKVRGSGVVVSDPDGPAIEDVAEFVKLHEVRGAGKENWRHVVMPSGRRCDDDYHAAMISSLESAGLWTGRKPRVAGKLVGAVEDALMALEPARGTSLSRVEGRAGGG